jgi:hypothetical protein
MKIIMIIPAVTLLAMNLAHAFILDSEGFLRNNDSSLAKRSWLEAQNDCVQFGKNLASIRSLSLISEQFGAVPTLNRNQVNPENSPYGYQRIQALNPDGTEDDFYFSDTGFIPPAGDLFRVAVWSGSLDPSGKFLYLWTSMDWRGILSESISEISERRSVIAAVKCAVK